MITKILKALFILLCCLAMFTLSGYEVKACSYESPEEIKINIIGVK